MYANKVLTWLAETSRTNGSPYKKGTLKGEAYPSTNIQRIGNRLEKLKSNSIGRLTGSHKEFPIVPGIRLRLRGWKGIEDS